MSTNQNAQAKVAQACMQIKGMIQRIKTRLEQYELFEEAKTSKTWNPPSFFTRHQAPTGKSRRPQGYIPEDQSALFEVAITSADSYPSSSSTPQGLPVSVLPPPWQENSLPSQRQLVLLLYPADCQPFVNDNKSILDAEMKRFYRLPNFDFDYLPVDVDHTISICSRILSLPNLRGIFSLAFLYEPDDLRQTTLQLMENLYTCIETLPPSKNLDFMRIFLIPKTIKNPQIPKNIADYSFDILYYTTNQDRRREILSIINP